MTNTERKITPFHVISLLGLLAALVGFAAGKFSSTGVIVAILVVIRDAWRQFWSP